MEVTAAMCLAQQDEAAPLAFLEHCTEPLLSEKL